jgi:hypothetical protein
VRIVQVDELLRQLADYKNDYADMAAAKRYGCARPVGMLTATCKTVCMMCGCPIASGNRSDSPRGIVNYYLDGQTQVVIGLSIKTLATVALQGVPGVAQDSYICIPPTQRSYH